VTGVLIVLAGIGVAWRWTRTLPPPPPEAERWYQQGTEALRNGAFHTAATLLEEAIRNFPEYGVAYARLAEARAELDDEDAAQQALVRMSQHVPNESRLPQEARRRLDAIRSVVLRDVDRAVQAYGELAASRPSDAAAWLDLGRAQETAGQLSDAQASFERAAANDRQYAAAHLRLGIIFAATGQTQESLKAYDEAQRLYRASTNVEGEAEVLIRRGSLLDVSGDFEKARTSFEQALAKATTIDNPFQIVRARLHLSSVKASAGESAEAERLASTAVREALDAGLETVAADGLIDLTTTLTQMNRLEDAEVQLRKASALAEDRKARRVAARARLQMAALRLDQDRPADALTELTSALEFFKRHKYRQYELQGLTIAAHAYQDLGDTSKAHDLATEALKVAEMMRNDIQVGVALGALAAQAAALGSLPEALTFRERAEAIHRRQNDTAQLPYDLTNRAELLIRLGRIADAEKALADVEEGIRQNVAVYVGRQRRVTFLRALAAVVTGRFDQAAQLARAIRPEPGSTDSASVVGPALLEYAEARRSPAASRTTPRRTGPSVPPPARALERQYWWAAASLARGRAQEARALASDGLKELSKLGNDELQWRLAALAAIAARADGLDEQQRAFRAQAAEALARLRAKWGEPARAYESRPDLAQLRRDARL
jgi:tetratricopeptide (TPR) repeat protein